MKVTLKGSSGDPFKIQTDKNIICDNESLVLQLENRNQTVDWYLNNTFLKKDKSISVSKPGQYFAKAMASADCPNSRKTDSLTLTVGRSPFLSVSPLANGYKLCNGDTVV